MSRASMVPNRALRGAGSVQRGRWFGADGQHGLEALAPEGEDTSSSAEPPGLGATRGRYNKRRNLNLSCTHCRLSSPVLPTLLLCALIYQTSSLSGPWPDLARGAESNTEIQLAVCRGAMGPSTEPSPSRTSQNMIQRADPHDRPKTLPSGKPCFLSFKVVIQENRVQLCLFSGHATSRLCQGFGNQVRRWETRKRL